VSDNGVVWTCVTLAVVAFCAGIYLYGGDEATECARPVDCDELRAEVERVGLIDPNGPECTITWECEDD
jgi:hypothetical protein